jgi:hypothetical protein
MKKIIINGAPAHMRLSLTTSLVHAQILQDIVDFLKEVRNLGTSKVVSLTASTKAPTKAPTEGKHWPLLQLVSFQASTSRKPLKWCGRCDSPWRNCKCQAKKWENTPQPILVSGGRKFQYDEEEPTVEAKQQKQTVETSKHKTVWKYPIQSPSKPKQALHTIINTCPGENTCANLLG